MVTVTLISGLACFGHAFLSTPSIPCTSATTRLLSAANLNYNDDSCDVLVIGSGPAGCAIASLLGSSGDLDVVVANKNFEADWVPNYGVWKDEWQTVLDRYKSLGMHLEGGKFGRSMEYRVLKYF